MKQIVMLAALAAGPALAADCPPMPMMDTAAREWLAGERLPDPQVTTMAQADCANAAFAAVLAAELGAPVGVKVGFTSKPVQERFGVTAPVAGALYAPMLLDDGAKVSMAGSRTPFYEADLVVTVGSDAIRDARTRDDVAAALSDVRPFIELPDMAIAEGIKPTGPIMAAYGVMPWRGVLGQGVAIADLADPVADLGALSVNLKADGQTVAQGTGEMLLGHPLDVVLWLVQQGRFDMPVGTMISLGSLSDLKPAEPGVTVSADYSVGGKAMTVSATLVD